jgi:branched-subunit amino acid ABC-type transport system permease component
LVSGRAADLDDAGADRLRDAGLAVFRAVERVSPAYRTIPALLLLVIVMYIRPQGLLGRR